jgi:hypothetical protein
MIRFGSFFVNDKFSLLLIEGTCEKPWTALLANVKAPCVGLSRKCSVCCQESPRILKLFIAKWTPNAASHTTNACANPSGVVINQVQLINADVSVVPNGMDSTSSLSHDLAIGQSPFFRRGITFRSDDCDVTHTHVETRGQMYKFVPRAYGNSTIDWGSSWFLTDTVIARLKPLPQTCLRIKKSSHPSGWHSFIFGTSCILTRLE